MARKTAVKEPEVEDFEVGIEPEQQVESQPTKIIADLYPAGLRPWPKEVPETKVRAVLTDTHLTVLWEGYGGDRPLERVDYYLPEGPGPQATSQGGLLASGIALSLASGCQCGARSVRQANVWPHLG